MPRKSQLNNINFVGSINIYFMLPHSTLIFCSQLAKERAEELKRKAETEGASVRPKKAKQPLKVFRDGVGKYLNLQEASTTSKVQGKPQDVPAKKPKKEGGYGFKGFDNW